MKVGVISDTHDYLDPKAVDRLVGVDHILHAGDIGLPWLILDLEEIAPVTAVLGNTDDSRINYRPTEVVALGGKKFLVHHIVNPRELGDTVKARINRERPDVVVFGHTHKPFAETINGVFYFNPGYAGKPRFGLERSVALLTVDKGEIRHEFLPI